MRAARTACTESGIGEALGELVRPPGAVVPLEDAGLDQLSDELLEEERISLGTSRR